MIITTEPPKPISATVFIRYPCTDSPSGHAAMYIGQHDPHPGLEYMHKRVDVYSSNNKENIRDVLWQDGMCRDDEPFGEMVQQMYHVIYELYDLDVDAMLEAKRNICHPNMHYSFLLKNCSTVVSRILKAGGVERLLNNFNRIAYGKNLYWTPKDIAQLCDKLRDNNKATKYKFGHCPRKRDNIFRSMFGLR
ncbi:hypothetical protein [Xenorhabdus bharatensis]|uniref:hypothetical protein n=1 Tax=Xenorhabdus bharatensis TaxID=3136256 RepID=UPI0030F4037E